MTCIPCNLYEETTKGGLAVGGTANVTDTTTKGSLSIGGSAAVDVAGNLWDGFEAVWLLDDLTDETNHGRDGTAVEGYSPTDGTALLCLPCQEFEGRQFVPVPVAGVDFASVSGWVRLDAFYQDRALLTRPGLRFGFTVLRQPYLRISDGTSTDTAYSTTALQQGRWHHVAATWTPGGTIRVYVDGQQTGSKVTSVAALADGTAAYLGRDGAGSYPQCGLADVRLHSEAKPLAWWEAERAALCPGLVTEGATEEVTYS